MCLIHHCRITNVCAQATPTSFLLVRVYVDTKWCQVVGEKLDEMFKRNDRGSGTNYDKHGVLIPVKLGADRHFQPMLKRKFELRVRADVNPYIYAHYIIIMTNTMDRMKR